MNQIYQSAALAVSPLAASAIYTSPWFATGTGSGQSVRVVSYSDQTGTLILQQTDDPGLPNQIYEVARTQTSGNAASKLEFGITSNLWRFVYTNGTVAQTTFSVTANSSSDVQAAILIELRRLNMQINAMRGMDDNGKEDFSQI